MSHQLLSDKILAEVVSNDGAIENENLAKYLAKYFNIKRKLLKTDNETGRQTWDISLIDRTDRWNRFETNEWTQHQSSGKPTKEDILENLLSTLESFNNAIEFEANFNNESIIRKIEVLNKDGRTMLKTYKNWYDEYGDIIVENFLNVMEEVYQFANVLYEHDEIGRHPN